MSEIIRKPEATMAEWDPMRMMREMLRWDPFSEMAPMVAMPTLARVGWNPRFEVTETVDAYVWKGDLPGVKREDLEISATGNRLQISGKREREQETKTETVFSYEREFGSFMRAFTLPASADIEHAKSELKDGVLTLVIPKKAGMQAKKIAVGSPTGKS
jgi:HSP20 family protein